VFLEERDESIELLTIVVHLCATRPEPRPGRG
jgi:hypothetical protein